VAVLIETSGTTLTIMVNGQMLLQTLSAGVNFYQFNLNTQTVVPTLQITFLD
jgi:hypothetical protein